MQQELQEKMCDLGRQPQTYLLVTDPTENAAGLLATLDLMVRGRGKEEQGSERDAEKSSLR